MGWLEIPPAPLNGPGMSKTDTLPYRPCVGAMMVNAAGQAFVGKRIDNREGDFWQMPQGGIDEGEDCDKAVFRELWEETGAAAEHVEVVARLPEELFYDLPDSLKGKLWGGRYLGQRQTWFLARFLGTDDDVHIDTPDPEFRAWKWAEPRDLPTLIVPFKKKLYEEVLGAFGHWL